MGNSVMINVNPNSGPVNVAVDNNGSCTLVLSADSKQVEFPVSLKALGGLKTTERIGADRTTVTIDNKGDSVEVEVGSSGDARAIVDGIQSAQMLLTNKVLSKQNIKTLALGFMGGILFVFLYYYLFIRVQLTPEMVAQIRALQVQQQQVAPTVVDAPVLDDKRVSNSETWEPK